MVRPTLSEGFCVAYARMNAQQNDASWLPAGRKKLVRFGPLDRAVADGLVGSGRKDEAELFLAGFNASPHD